MLEKLPTKAACLVLNHDDANDIGKTLLARGIVEEKDEIQDALPPLSKEPYATPVPAPHHIDNTLQTLAMQSTASPLMNNSHQTPQSTPPPPSTSTQQQKLLQQNDKTPEREKEVPEKGKEVKTYTKEELLALTSIQLDHVVKSLHAKRYKGTGNKPGKVEYILKIQSVKAKPEHKRTLDALLFTPIQTIGRKRKTDDWPIINCEYHQKFSYVDRLDQHMALLNFRLVYRPKSIKTLWILRVLQLAITQSFFLFCEMMAYSENTGLVSGTTNRRKIPVKYYLQLVSKAVLQILPEQ